MDPPISVATSDLKTPPIQALASGELAPIGKSVDTSPSIAAVDNPLTSSTSAVSSVPSPASSNLKTSADQAALTSPESSIAASAPDSLDPIKSVANTANSLTTNPGNAADTTSSNSGGTTGLGSTTFSVEQGLIGKPVAPTPDHGFGGTLL
jgi:hypothetical protein